MRSSGTRPSGSSPQSSPHAAIIGYNTLFLFTYALAFLGAYLLARELRGRLHWAPPAAGAAFAYAPWKPRETDIFMFSRAAAFRFALFLLVRGYRRERPSLVLAGLVRRRLADDAGLHTRAAALLPSSSFSRSGAGIALALRWLPRPRRGVATATLRRLSGMLIPCRGRRWMARPYMRVLDAHPRLVGRVPYVQSLLAPNAELCSLRPSRAGCGGWGRRGPVRRCSRSRTRCRSSQGSPSRCSHSRAFSDRCCRRRLRLGLGIASVVSVRVALARGA